MRQPQKQPWFSHKRYGYGASLPIRWQGWVLMIGYLAAVFAATPLCLRLLSPAPAAVATGIAIAVLTVPFLLVVKSRTEGGWRWRNGKD